VDGEAVSRFTRDGLILSTPIGSTGPQPVGRRPYPGTGIDGVCHHAHLFRTPLTTRPGVDSADKVYTIAIQRFLAGNDAHRDGQEQIPMGVGCCVTVRRAPVSFGLVKVPSRS